MLVLEGRATSSVIQRLMQWHSLRSVASQAAMRTIDTVSLQLIEEWKAIAQAAPEACAGPAAEAPVEDVDSEDNNGDWQPTDAELDLLRVYSDCVGRSGTWLGNLELKAAALALVCPIISIAVGHMPIMHRPNLKWKASEQQEVVDHPWPPNTISAQLQAMWQLACSDATQQQWNPPIVVNNSDNRHYDAIVPVSPNVSEEEGDF